MLQDLGTKTISSDLKEYISMKNTKQPLLVFIPGTFYPGKQEAVKKITSELLSGNIELIVWGVCVLLQGTVAREKLLN